MGGSFFTLRRTKHFIGKLWAIRQPRMKSCCSGLSNQRGIVFTHDLDFSALLAVRNLRGPTVIQLRGQETTPSKLGEVVLRALSQLGEELERGAVVAVQRVVGLLRYVRSQQ